MEKRPCSIPGCTRPFEARGWCGTHYMRWYVHGDPLTVKKKPGRKAIAFICRINGCERSGPYVRGLCKLHYTRWDLHGDPLWEPKVLVRPPCSVEGCDRLSYVRGWCRMHYMRWRDHGEAGEAAPRRKAAGDGHIDELGYHRVTVNGVKQKGHRYAMEQKLGRALLPDETVHHVNGVRDDNRPENLELWVGMHGKGQRVEDLVEFVLDHYSDLVEASQNRRAAR